MANVSEIDFMGFAEDKGTVSIRQFEEMEDEKAFKITKIIAHENCSDGTVTVEYIDEEECLTEDISQRLFPKR